MSKQIDERVVEMRFDNQQFEKNVNTSMSTIDKLKEKLKFKGASDGLEKLSSSVKKTDMSPLGNGVEAVRAKFSALQVAGMTALANITNSAVNAGKRIVSALTIDPIKTGFQEYETQIGAVQTILANTESKGSTLQDVNSALDTLNTYADKTIYNFTEMTRNIGTFTAAGVDLKTSVSSIQGIANLAAVSGSTSQQASTAMYQLSQALAAGTVKLMDWNSVVNAGMGGQVFQDALKRTATVMGTNVDAIIEKNGSFRESLQEGWITAEVLTKTLEQFTMAAEEGSDEWNRYKKSLQDDGYTEAQANEILKMANTATEAATKVKTFTQLWDTLKESAQSGWTQTWEIIIGDFGEAKEFLTSISDTLGSMIGASAESRNQLLSSGLSTGWKQLLDQGIADEAGFIDSIKEVAKTHNATIDEMIEKEQGFGAALAAGLKDGSITSDMLTESVTNLADKMRNMTDAEREAAGYTKEHISQIEKLEAGLKDGSISMDEFAEKMMRPSGRENLIQSLQNAFEGLMSVVKPIKEAFSEIFPPATGEQLYALTEKIRAFSEKLKISEDTANSLKSTFEGVFSVIKVGVNIFMDIVQGAGKLISAILPLGDGLLSVAGSIGNFLTGISEAISEMNILETVFNGAANIFGAVATGIGSVLKSLASGIEKCGGLIGIVKKVIDVIGQLFDKISTALPGNSIFDTLFNLVNSGMFAAIGLWIAKTIKSLSDFSENAGGFLENLTGILEGVGDALDAFVNSIKADALKKIAVAIGILAASLLVLSLIDPGKLTTALIAMSVAFGELIGAMAIMDKLFAGNKFTSLLKLGTLASTMIKLSVALLILAGAIKILSTMSWEEMGVGLISMSVGLSALVIAVGKLPENTEKKAAGLIALASAMFILSVALKIMSTMSLEEMSVSLIGMMVGLTALVKALDMIPENVASKAASIVILASAMLILSVALKIMSTMSLEEMSVSLIGMMVGLTALVKSLDMIPENVASKAASIVILASAMLILSVALKIFASMSIEDMAISIAAMASSLYIFVLALKTIPQDMAGKAASIVILAAAMIVLGMALKIFASMSVGEIAKGIISMAVALGVFAGLSYLLAPVAPIMLMIGGAIALLGVGCMAAGAGLILISTGIVALATAIVSSAGIIIAGAAEIVGVFTTIILSLVTAITECIPAITNGLLQLLVSVLQGLVQYAPQLIDLVVDLIIALLDGLAARAPEFVESVANFIVAIINGLASQVPKFIEAAINLVGAIIQGIADFIGPIIEQIVAPLLSVVGDIIVGIVEAIAPYIPVICDAFVKISDNIVRMTEIIAPCISDIINAFTVALMQISPIIDSIANLVTQVGNVIMAVCTGIATVISSIFTGISTTITSACTGIAEIITSIFSGIADTINSTLSGVADIIDTVFTGISDTITSIGESIRTVLDGIAGIFDSIGNAALNAGTGMEHLANAIVTITGLKLADMAASLAAVATGISNIATHGANMQSVGTAMSSIVSSISASTGALTGMGAAIGGVVTALASVATAGTTAMTGLTTAVKTAANNVVKSAGQFKSAGTTIINNLINGVKSKTSALISLFKQTINTIISNIRAMYQSFHSAGAYCAQGFAAGIKSNTSLAADAGTALGKAALDAAKAKIESASPSKKFMELGLWSVQGFANGITDNLGYAKNAATGLGEAVLTATQDYLGIHSPSVVFDKEVGRYIVQGIANGIAEETEAEQKAREKAEKIVSAFKEAFDKEIKKYTTGKSISENDLELWKLWNPKATDEEVYEKELAFYTEDAARQNHLAKLAHDQWRQAEDLLKQGTMDEQEVNDLYEKYQKQQIEAKQASDKITEVQNEYFNSRINSIIESADKQQELRDAQYDFWLSAHEDASDELKNRQNERYLRDWVASLWTKQDAYIEAWHKAVEIYGETSNEALEAEKLMAENAAKINSTTDSIKQIAIDQAKKDRDTFEEAQDIAMSISDRQYNIWEKTIGRDASDAEKDERKLSALVDKTTYQAKLLDSARTAWIKAKEDSSLSENEKQKAYQEYLDAEYNLVSTQSDILDVQESIADRQKRLADKQKLARKEYDDYIEKYKKYYIENGKTLEELEKDAKLVSGYDPSAVVSKSAKTTTKVANNDFDDVGAAIAKAVCRGMKSTSSDMTETAVVIGRDILKTVTSNDTAWIQSGMAVADRFIEGIKSRTEEAKTAANSLATDTLNALQDSIDSKERPVIKPVLDLTAASEQLARLTAITSSAQAMGISASLAGHDRLKEQLEATGTTGDTTYQYNQYNYSPKALSRTEIYRDTKTLLATTKGASK